MKIDSLAIVIPCLNEIESIDSMVEEILLFKEKVLKEKTLNKVELIVVDDGSVDGSLEVLKQKSQQGELELLQTQKKKGYGAALKLGFKSHSCSHVCFFDMDQTYPVSAIEPMISQLEKNKVDVAIGVRLSDFSEMPKLRMIGNKTFRLMIRVLFSKFLQDPCSGMWVFKKELFEKFESHLPSGLNFTLKFSLLVLTHNISFIETPINYKKRYGLSKLSIIKDGFKFSYTIFISRLFG